jgi:glycosyltransferase involved in cell wall biosynthesis
LVRILLTLHNFIPEPTLGAENVAIAQIRELRRNGHDVALFYAGNKPPTTEQLTGLGLGGIELFRVPYRPTKAQVLLSIRKPAVERAFVRALRAFGPSVVVFHHLVRLSMLLPALAARAGIPSAYVLHDYYLVCPSYSLFAWDENVCRGGAPLRCARCLYASRFRRKPSAPMMWAGALAVWWRNRIVRDVVGQIDLFVTPSAVLVEQMASRGLALTKSVVVRNGQEPGSPHAVSSEIRRPVRFGYLGGVSRKKGLEVLARAFRGDLGRQLVIRGFASESDAASFRADHPGLEARLECFDTDREGFYREIDVVVVPSVWLENQPMVVLEAFAHGKPVLASRIGGLPEMFVEGIGGLFFKAGDPDALRAVASALADDPCEIERLARTIPRWPTWPEVTAELLSYLEALAKSRTDRPSPLPAAFKT